jgi:biopolymer transport protein ExbD
MGFVVQSPHEDNLSEHSEINVTPFIDVILVLLIIFMVAAPLSTVDIPVDLPAASAPPQPVAQKPVYVTLKADMSVSVGEDSVEWQRLGSALDVATIAKRDTRIFIRADKSVPYGDVIRLFNEMRTNGYLKVSLVAADQGGSSPSASSGMP